MLIISIYPVKNVISQKAYSDLTDISQCDSEPIDFVSHY